MSKTLFIENSPFLTRLVIADELKESISIKQGKNNTLIVKNIPGTILNRTNQNGRIYSTAEIQRAIDAARPQIETKQLLCSCDEHPEGSFVSPSHAAFVIIGAYIKKNVKLEVEGEKGSYDVLFCDIEVLNTSEGKNLQALLLSGCSLGTSIRGLGDMDGDQVVNYEFLGFDIVSNPSSGTFTNMPIYEAKIESIEENALNEATKFTVSTYASNTTHDLNQAMQFQNKVSNSLEYGTITNMNTKMDQEVDPKTGVEKTVGEVEVETSDDTSDLKTALEIAGRAFTNPDNVNVTSITIEKVDEDDDMKDSVQTDEAVLKEEDPTEEDGAGRKLYDLWKSVYGDQTMTVRTSGPDVGIFPAYDGSAICYGVLDGQGGVSSVEDSVPYAEGDSLTTKVSELMDKVHEAYGYESDLLDSTQEEEKGELQEAPLWGTMAKFKDWGHSAVQGIKNAFHNYQTNVSPEEIWKAVSKGQNNFLQGCIDHGVNLNIKQNGVTPLMYAATHAMPETVDVLAKDKNLLDATNMDGNTALILATAYAKDKDVVDTLLRNGANMDVANKNGKTVFDYAQNKPEIMEVLQKYKEAPKAAEKPASVEPQAAEEPKAVEEPVAAEEPAKEEPKAVEPEIPDASDNAETVNYGKPEDENDFVKNVEKLQKTMNKQDPAVEKAQACATNRLKVISKLLKTAGVDVNAEDPETGYTLLDDALLKQDEILATLIKDMGGKNSKKLKSELNALKHNSRESVEDSEEVLTEKELSAGMWIKTQLLDPTAVYYVDEVTDDGVFLIKHADHGPKIFIETDGSFIFPWEEVKDEENESAKKELWDINVGNNEVNVDGDNSNVNADQDSELEIGLPLPESAQDGTIEQQDDTLVIDVDGNEIEKEFRTPEEARIAKAGLENGKLSADVMYSESSSWWALKLDAGDFADWFVTDANEVVDITANQDQATVFPTEEEARKFQQEKGCEEYEYENGLRTDVTPVQLGITDDDIFGKQEEANMDEKLYANEDPASDSFEQEPVIEDTDDLKVVLGEISYDVDDEPDFEGDPKEIEELLENHLPETIEIQLNGNEVPEENAEQFIYEKAREQTGLPIKNATILEIEEIKKKEVKEEDEVSMDMDATTDMSSDDMSGLEGTSGAVDMADDEISFEDFEEAVTVGAPKRTVKPQTQAKSILSILDDNGIDRRFTTTRPLFDLMGNSWRIQAPIPANPNSLRPEERVVRFALKPFNMESDEKIMDRIVLTVDELKDWIERPENKDPNFVQQVDVANNRKTSALANRFDTYSDDHSAKLPHWDVLGNAATHGVHKGKFTRKKTPGKLKLGW